MFVIRAVVTDETSWPDFLRDERGNSLIGFPFYDPISKRPYGWRDTSDRNEEFSKQLWTLKTALTARLRELRARYESRPRIQPAALFAPPPPVAPPIPPAGAGERRRIYLHARGDQAPARSEVERLLTQINIIPLSARIDVGNALADWSREAKARFEAAKRCDALALVRANQNEGFIGDLLDIGVDERDRIQSERGKPLPCAVLDQSGAPLPIDVSALGIRRFDLRHQDWQSEFGTWLEDARGRGVGGNVET